MLSAWAADYQKQSGARINYRRSAPGAHLSRPGPSTWPSRSASDELAKANLAQFPIVIGAIVAVVNLPIQAGTAEAHRPLLADIYAGKVEASPGPAMHEHHAGVTLPSASIAVVRRSDGQSGTTFNFTRS